MVDGCYNWTLIMSSTPPPYWENYKKEALAKSPNKLVVPIPSWEIACMVDAKLAKETGILHTGEILTKRIYDTCQSTVMEIFQTKVEDKHLEIKIGNPMPEVKVQVMAGTNADTKVRIIGVTPNT